MLLRDLEKNAFVGSDGTDELVNTNLLVSSCLPVKNCLSGVGSDAGGALTISLHRCRETMEMHVKC